MAFLCLSQATTSSSHKADLSQEALSTELENLKRKVGADEKVATQKFEVISGKIVSLHSCTAKDAGHSRSDHFYDDIENHVDFLTLAVKELQSEYSSNTSARRKRTKYISIIVLCK